MWHVNLLKRGSPIRQIMPLPHVTDLTDGTEARRPSLPAAADPGPEAGAASPHARCAVNGTEQSSE